MDSSGHCTLIVKRPLPPPGADAAPPSRPRPARTSPTEWQVGRRAAEPLPLPNPAHPALWVYFARAVPLILSGLALSGWAVRLTVQDRVTGPLAYLYYSTPPVVLTGLLLTAATGWALRRRTRLAGLLAAAGLACGAWMWQTPWHASPSAVAGGDIRVLFWNVARGARGWDGVATEIRSLDADIVGLAEAGQDVAAMEEFWRAVLPEYTAVVAPTGVTLLARGEVEVIGASTMDPWGRHLHARVFTAGGPLHVVVFDVSHSMWRSRSTAIEPLMHVLEPLRGEPVLVLGDFNTPPDSVFFEPLRRDYVNAFEVAGAGYAATWPLPLPVLTLDQAWASPAVHVHRAELGWSGHSDHRPLILELGRGR